jgi:branched-chain amino acid transport system ATP-binding protein
MSFFAINGLSVIFDGLRAVSDVSLALGEGEIHGVIGPNGAGKTSLINAVSGLVPASAGAITIGGRALHTLPAHRRAAAGVGRTFQHGEIFADRTVVANVMTGGFVHRRSSLFQDLVGTPGKAAAERAARRDAEEMLDAFGMLALCDAIAGDLPFGIQKKIDLARALMTRPRMLMLDEPTSGMNETEAQEVIGTCRRIAAELHVTLLVIEHNMRVIMGLAQTIHVLDHGEKIAVGSPEEVQRNPVVIEAYLGHGSAVHA